MLSVKRKHGDVVVIKVYDDRKNCIYKDTCNISDKKDVERLLASFREKFGIEKKEEFLEATWE